jgi:hypothetical protein
MPESSLIQHWSSIPVFQLSAGSVHLSRGFLPPDDKLKQVVHTRDNLRKVEAQPHDAACRAIS